jgi:hypothetical protein
VLGGDLPHDVGARLVRPRARLRLAVHQDARGLALDGQRLEALELLHDDAARRRHVAGVAPGHFERRAAHQLRTLEQREVEVVELERDLVGLLLGVLVGEGDDAPARSSGSPLGARSLSSSVMRTPGPLRSTMVMRRTSGAAR